MSKLPYMKFYAGDFLLATRILTDTEKSIWIDLLCFMWLKKTGKGYLEGTFDDIARLLGCDRLVLEASLNSIKKKQVCIVKLKENQTIYIESRRMVAEAKKLTDNKNRQKNFNNESNNASYNALYNANITQQKSEVRIKNKDNTLRFVKPSAAHITEYAQTLAFDLDGQAFVDYYDSKGWLVGKSAMRDWRAAVRTWKRRKSVLTQPPPLEEIPEWQKTK